MVLQWAQLGYLIIHLDDNGRVFLHKKMDMGNERSTFELRCFRDLFGRKMMLDTTGYRFQKTCLKASALSRRQAHGHRSPAAAVQLFRALSALLGAFAGVAMADAVSTHHTWRIVLMAALGIVFMVACWLIQEGMSALHLRSKASLKLTALLCPIVLLTGYFCGVFLYGLGAVAWNLLAGLLAAYGLAYGDYYWKETEAPSGYNLPKTAIMFNVNEASLEEGMIVIVENVKGNILPSTGGIGTTVFYAVGFAMMLAAVVLLVTKRRMSAE
jgi:LPXTG-motif cell wall-anchored protein